MKKLPIFLSTLSLCGLGTAGLTGLSATALDIPAGVAGNDLTIQSADGVAEDMIYGATNEFDEVFKMTYVRPTTRMMEVWTRSGATNRAIHRLFVVGYDYENGVTEAEADAKYQGLGVEDTTSWAREVAYYETDNPDPKREFATQEGVDLTVDNQTDVLYFAAEFGDFVRTKDGVEWSNLSWRRGKVDYRNCVHGGQYKEGAYCKPVTGVDGKIDFWPYGRVHDLEKPVMTWNEEWRGIQKERLETHETEVSELKAQVEAEVEAEGKISDETEATITLKLAKLMKMQVTLATLDENAEVTQMKEKRETLEGVVRGLLQKKEEKPEERPEEKPEKPGTTESGQNKPNGGENGSPNEGETGSGGESGTEAEKPNGGGAGAETGVETGNVGETNGAFGGDHRGGEARSGMQRAEGGSKTQQIAQGTGISAEAGPGENEDLAVNNWGEGQEKSGERQNIIGADEQAEVPNLGEEKAKFNIWTILLPVIAGGLTLIWLWARRALAKDED